MAIGYGLRAARLPFHTQTDRISAAWPHQGDDRIVTERDCNRQIFTASSALCRCRAISCIGTGCRPTYAYPSLPYGRCRRSACRSYRIKRIAGNHARFVEIETAITSFKRNSGRISNRLISSPSTGSAPRLDWRGAPGQWGSYPSADKLINLFFNRGVWRQAEGNAWFCQEPMVFIATRASIKPQYYQTKARARRRRYARWRWLGCQIRFRVHLFADFQ